MRVPSSRLIIAACGLAAALSGTACADRGEMYSNGNDNSAANKSEDRTPITVTGCFQEASGFNNFVVTNLTGSQGSPEERAKGYRVEQGGDLEQHVGKQVRVTGWIEADKTASMQGDQASRPTGTSGQYEQRSSDRTDFNDLPELHVDHIERVSDNCTNTQAGAQPKTQGGAPPKY